MYKYITFTNAVIFCEVLPILYHPIIKQPFQFFDTVLFYTFAFNDIQ